MKKFISFGLLLCAVLSFTAFSGEAKTVTRSGAAAEIVRKIYNEGSETPFPFSELYCLHASGYVHFVPFDAGESCPLLCEINQSVEGSGFSDVSSENENAIFLTLAKKMEIIGGYGDNSFCPESDITYNEAVKMLICGLGYGERALSGGGYPDGYLNLAVELGLTENLVFSGNDFIPAQVFSGMLEKAFSIKSYPMQNVMGVFSPPKTPQDCINLYANARQERNGAVLYALSDAESREKEMPAFKDFLSAVGPSSPWIFGFESEESDLLHYAVTFFYASSTGPEGEKTFSVELKEQNGTYKIASVQAVSD